MTKDMMGRLADLTKIRDRKELLNFLQTEMPNPVVSDQCVDLAEVADSDALRAYVRISREVRK